MPARELTEWMAFYSVSPFGEERADVRAGIVAAVVANTHRNPKRRKKPYEVKDFMPKWGRREDTRETLMQKMSMIAAAFGGSDGDNREPGS